VTCKPVGGARELSARHLAHDYVKNGGSKFHRAAITAQQFCSICFDKNLIRRDGISKTLVWKNYARCKELRTCENVPE
jgi:hypothetical protein